MSRGASGMRGLYAVTPDVADTSILVQKVDAALSGGAVIVQYRNKTAGDSLRREQAHALQDLCARRGVALIVNDHVELAREVGAAGVHIGAEDGTLEDTRRVLGAGRLIGVSCYNRLELAQSAQAGGADYVAFGSFFPSTVKPGAVKATPALLERARDVLQVPIVAIGGVTADNARELVRAGADAVAVISALFSAPDVAREAGRFASLFAMTHDAQR